MGGEGKKRVTKKGKGSEIRKKIKGLFISSCRYLVFVPQNTLISFKADAVHYTGMCYVKSR